MRKLYLCLFLLIPIFSQAQTWNWTATMGSVSSSTFDGYRVVRTDPAGNVFVMGRMVDTLFAGTDTLLDAEGETYISKYNSNGNLLWVRQVRSQNGNTLGMEAYDMLVDTNGFLYLTGWYYGQNLVFGADTVSNSYGADFFLMKLDTAINPVWMRTATNISLPQINTEAGQALALDAYGRICVAASYNNTTDISGFIVNSNAVTRADMFAAVYDPNGNCAWVVNMKSQFDSYGTGIACDDSGNIYFCGRHYGNLVCQNDTLFAPLSNAWSHNIAKLDSAGNLTWNVDVAHNYGGTFSNDLTIKDARLYSCGELAGSVTHNSTNYTANGSGDLYIASLDLDGNVLWFMNSGYPGADQSNHIELDDSTNIFISGHFSKPIPFCADTIWPVGYNPAQSWFDHFVIKTDSAGTIQWFLPTGSAANDFYISNVHVGYNNEIFTCGIFNDVILMDMNLYSPAGAGAGYVGSINNVPCCYAGLNVPQNNILCLGDTLMLDAGAGYTSYSWSTGDTTQQIFVTEEGLYAVLRTDTTSCITGSIPVFVDLKPDATISYFPMNACQGDTIFLSAGPDYYWQYLWSDSQNVFVPGITQSGSYWAIVSDMNGCTGSSDTVDITFSDPQAGFNVTTACAGQPAFFFDNSSYTPAWDSAYYWAWDFGSAPFYSGLQDPSHTYAQSGTYNVQLVIRNYSGCYDTVVISVPVDSLPPAPVITQNGNVLTSSSASGNQWLLDSVILPGETGQTFTWTTNGNYSVVVTNNCGSDTSNVIVIDVGMNENSGGKTFSVFPNPAHDGVMISSEYLTDEMTTVRILDLQGRVLQEVVISREQLQKGFYLAFEFEPSGAYVIEVDGAKKLLIRN
jgi:hypothetical protein